jgi:cell division transport system permease protein
LALPVLLGLGGLAAPFVGGAEWGGAALGRAEWGDGGWYQAELMRTMPRALWAGLPGLPLMAGAIGWVTAQATVRRWLRRLP